MGFRHYMMISHHSGSVPFKNRYAEFVLTVMATDLS